VSQAKGLILVHAEPEEGVARWPLADTPVELAPVANKPILVHQLEALAAAGILEVGVVGSPAIAPRLRAVVGEGERWGVRITHIAPSAPLTILESLLVAEEFVTGGPFVVELAGHLVRHDIAAAIAGLGDAYDAVVVGQPVRPSPRRERLLPWDGPGGGTTTVVSPVAGLDRVDVMALSPEVFPTVHELTASGPPLDGLTELIRRLQWSGRVRTDAVGGWGRRIRDAEDLVDANQRVLADLAADYDEERLEGATVQGAVAIHPTATVQSSILRGPSVIGPHAVLIDAFIGPYTSIGEGASVEGTELENCVILPGAVLKHPGIRLEGSVIGENARVSRGYGLPRAMRLWVGTDADISLG
jgi:glucose-1-phosphate thymidylyltransferase